MSDPRIRGLEMMHAHLCELVTLAEELELRREIIDSLDATRRLVLDGIDVLRQREERALLERGEVE